MIEGEFQDFIDPFGDDQRSALAGLRALVVSHSTRLDEAVTTGRWLDGFLFYSTSGQRVYAIGPKGKTNVSFPMMPFYGSAVLRQRHGEVLAPLLTGKSSIALRHLDDVPGAALIDIVERGTPVMQRTVTDHLDAGSCLRSKRT